MTSKYSSAPNISDLQQYPYIQWIRQNLHTQFEPRDEEGEVEAYIQWIRQNLHTLAALR